MAEETKTMKTLRERTEREREKKEAYATAHSVHAAKSGFITCPNCGSKLNRTAFKGEKCPLCNTELRSKTTIDTLAGYETNIKKWSKEYKELAGKHEKQVYLNKFVRYSFYKTPEETETTRPVTKDEMIAFMKRTKKPFKLTSGLAYRHPTVHNVPISRKEAISILQDRGTLVDVQEYGDYVHVNTYSANDMW